MGGVAGALDGSVAPQEWGFKVAGLIGVAPQAPRFEQFTTMSHRIITGSGLILRHRAIRLAALWAVPAVLGGCTSLRTSQEQYRERKVALESSDRGRPQAMAEVDVGVRDEP